MNLSPSDWKTLQRLRETFLRADPAARDDYWRSERDLELYDQTFGQRIRWKWDYVLRELKQRGWTPPPNADVFDWGCGSGIAGRAFLEHFGSAREITLVLYDRSVLATHYAQKRVRAEFPEAPTLVCNAKELAKLFGAKSFSADATATDHCRPRRHPFSEEATAPDHCSSRRPRRHPPARRESFRGATTAPNDFANPSAFDKSRRSNAVLLLSHVITELSSEQLDELIRVAQTAAVLWVEPGTHEASRALIGVREKLREQMSVVAPCTHQAACGILASGNERHWCHHFAPSPPEVFTDGDWARFARMAGIDLRSLPLSFLVMDRREPQAPPADTMRKARLETGDIVVATRKLSRSVGQNVSPRTATTTVASTAPRGDAMRIIGRPRLYKAHAQIFGCDATGVHDRTLMKRKLPEVFRKLQKGTIEPLQTWRCEGDEIAELRSIPQ